MARDALFDLRTTKPSLRMQLGVMAIKRQPRVFDPDPEMLRAKLFARDPVLDAPLPKGIGRAFDVERWEAAGHQCVTLHPRAGNGRQHIVYFHGGGFVYPMFDAHWPLVARLAKHSGASVTVPLYPVLPEHSRDEVTAHADAAYARVAEEWDPAAIILAGDSAGANIALAMAGRHRDAAEPPAGRLLLYSPLLDLTLADPAIAAIEADDCMLSIESLRMIGQLWAAPHAPASPQLSPLYADLRGLPPTAIFQGSHDIFAIDARSYAARARDAGAPVALYEYAGAPHVYMILGCTPEAKDTLRLSSAFINNLAG